MSGFILYVDRSTVHEGAYDQLVSGMRDLAEFVEKNEPDIPSYHVFFSEDHAAMTVVHVHTTPETLDLHLEIAGPEFAKVKSFLTLQSIDVYGRPSEHALEMMRKKAAMLGTGEVRVHELAAGFDRL